MLESSPDPTSVLFAQYVLRTDAGEEVDFEAFCAEHEIHADGLKRLKANHDERIQAQRLLGSGKQATAETVIALWIARGAEEDESLDVLCRKHPGLESELRHLHDAWQVAARELERAEPHVEPAHEQTGSALLGDMSFSGPGRSRYELKGEFARGGMGAILKIWDKDLRRELAMKVLLEREGVPADRLLARFLEEAQITGQVDHPGIVPVHELGIDSEGQVYFTMRLVKGQTLSEILRLVRSGEEGWSRTRALGVLLRACEAVSYAHSKGVIHRDLKPANIMVGQFGEVYAMDWGLARVLGEEDRKDIRLDRGTSEVFKTTRGDLAAADPDSPLVTMDGDVVGTPAFMSPEQARGEVEQVDRRSDVYSIGAILYELLTGQSPYAGTGRPVSPHAVLAAVLKGPPRPLHELDAKVPVELQAICEKAMSRESAQRYGDTVEMAEDLRAYLEGRVVRAHEVGAWAETRKWVQRNKHLAASLMAVIVLLGTGLVTTLFLREEAQANFELAEQRRLESDANEQLASEQARIATGRTQEVLRLAVAQDLEDLIAEARELYPAYPDRIDEYEDWISRARDLAGEIPSLVAKRDELRALALPLTREQERADREKGINERRTWVFSDEAEQETRARWWHSQLTGLIEELETFVEPRAGLSSETGVDPEQGWSVPRRLAFARRLQAGLAEGGEFARRWDEALGFMHATYPGLNLVPQAGLVPIGADPESGLWEFWHVQTGDEPVRGADGRVVVEEGMGLVMVLLPGGKFWMGAQSGSRANRNYDKDADPDEGPVHEVQMSAFFLSKYEMTQAQWLRAAGVDPSRYHQGFEPPEGAPLFDAASDAGRVSYTRMNPVERVSWLDCEALLPMLGLTLPSEAQWEYGCRAGTDTPQPFPASEFPARANIADRAGDRTAAWSGLEDWDDGFGPHAPVGSYPANAFGLCDMIGNVFEWCLDGYEGGFYGHSPYRDPVSPFAEADTRVLRGSSFYYPSIFARSADRHEDSPSVANHDLGVRPARAIDHKAF